MKDQQKRHAGIAREAAAGGIVLLQNEDHLLPLEAGTRVAVFGIGQIYTIKGGTGSGEVNNLHSVNLLEGLRASALRVDAELAGRYEAWAQTHPPVSQGLFAGEGAKNYNEEMPVWDVATLAERNDAALMIVSRLAGEGEDMAPEKGTIFLTDEESALLKAVSAAFSKTVLILNTAGFMEIGEYLDAVKSVLFVGLPGQEGGHAVADILTGRVPVSGKLNDTWPLSYWDYPGAGEYGRKLPSGNVCSSGFSDEETEQTLVPYHDDIYVGYRYFDTFGKAVRFPFGFGLSYGDPVIEHTAVTLEGETLVVQTRVKNHCTKHAAAQVVQVYVSSPDGRLEKPYQELKGFYKTGLLAPGEEETVTVTISLSELASYDTASAAYILEPGYYDIRVGTSSRSTAIAASLYLDREYPVLQLKNAMGTPPEGFLVLSKTGVAPITYVEEAAQRAAARQHPLIPGEISCSAADYTDTFTPGKPGNIRLSDVTAGNATLSDLAASMGLEDLCRLVCGQGMDFSSFDLSAVAPREGGDSGGANDVFSTIATARLEEPVKFEVVGEAGQSPDLRKEYDIPPLVLADGPAGVRITRDLPDGGHQYCTAFPTGSILACSFDEKLLTRFGQAAGEEMNAYGVDLWLAPGMNTHRNPLCGRNFEYYSEDPLLSGACAAAVTDGVQSQGGGVTIKHFAGNNQEYLRGNSNNLVTERALREIYLKGFEICVRRAKPKALMTSYNDINGVPSADNYDLLTTILRREWGFTGLVMTDWGGGVSLPAVSVCVGNDMIQPGGSRVVKKLLADVRAGEPVTSRGMAKITVTPTRSALEQSAVHILSVILNSKCAMERLENHLKA